MTDTADKQDETRPRDRYDQEVERLTAHPDYMVDSWWYSAVGRPKGFHSPLFDFCGERDSVNSCGCLTQVRAGRCAQTESLTEAIRQDSRIPTNIVLVKPAHLPAFAEWQRRIDKELGRTPPPMLAPDPVAERKPEHNVTGD